MFSVHHENMSLSEAILVSSEVYSYIVPRLNVILSIVLGRTYYYYYYYLRVEVGVIHLVKNKSNSVRHIERMRIIQDVYNPYVYTITIIHSLPFDLCDLECDYYERGEAYARQVMGLVF